MTTLRLKPQGGSHASKAVILLLLLLPLLPAVTACDQVAPVVKIGLVGPFEGRHRAVGYDVIYSARLAVRRLNHAGGVGGYRVMLVSLDDSGEADLAVGTAESLIIDPAVVAVVGHWLPETTAAAEPIYRRAGMPFIVAGQSPFDERDPEALPVDFRDAYQEVTPFDEEAGPFAAASYDAFQLLWRALALAEEEESQIDRQGVADALSGLTYDGLGGTVYQIHPEGN